MTFPWPRYIIYQSKCAVKRGTAFALKRSFNDGPVTEEAARRQSVKLEGEMRLRKVSRFLLALVLILGLCVPAAYAAEAPEVSISSGTVAPGGEVTLTVSIRNNPGIAATVLYIYYDSSIFSADPNRDVRAAGDFRSDGGMMNNTISTARSNGRYSGREGAEGLLALWYNSSGLNTYGDGAMLTVTLHANGGAPAGAYEVGVGYAEKDCGNQDGQRVALTTLPGTVTVTGNGTQTPADQGGNQDNQQGQTPKDPSPNPEEPGTDYPGGEAGDRLPADGTDPGGEMAVLFEDAVGNWAESFIQRAAGQGLIQGYNGLYRPNDSMTRAELVTILWRASGSPTGGAASFTDLTQDWYKDAVAWAERTGAVNGVGNGRFDPDGRVSREQLAAILHRMAGSPMGMEALVYDVYDQQYADSAQVSDWAKQSLYWAVFNEIYCGEAGLSVGQVLAPGADASRAQIAVMMVRYLDKND